jgi:broad specificity phosphatase PhoE
LHIPRESFWGEESIRAMSKKLVLKAGDKHIVCIRHGESLAQIAANRRSPEYLDCQLSSRGLKQCKEFVKSQKLDPPQLVLTSPLTRALQTTCLLFKTLSSDVPIVCCAEICEMGSEIPENRGRPLKKLLKDDELACLPKFSDIDFSRLPEAWPEMPPEMDSEVVRMRVFMRFLSHREEKHIVLVAHCRFLQALLCTRGYIKNCVPLFTVYDHACKHLKFVERPSPAGSSGQVVDTAVRKAKDSGKRDRKKTQKQKKNMKGGKAEDANKGGIVRTKSKKQKQRQ